MRADALRNRERLMEVAQAAFATHGVDTSLEEIARQAGVGIGTLYRRFPSREDLIAAVLAERYLKLVDCAVELAHTEDPDTALTQWMTLLLEHMAIYRGLSLAVKEAMHDATTTLGQTCQQMLQAGQQLVERGQGAGIFRADVTFYDLISMISGIAWAAERRQEKPHTSDLPQLDPHLLLSILLNGIRTKPE